MLDILVSAAIAVATDCPPRSQGCPPPANIWRIEFEDWVDDHLHWNAPSYVELNTSDGSLVFYASHLAHMKRDGIFDSGVMRRLIVTISFYGEPNCQGAVIGVDRRLVYPGLGYKREEFDYRRLMPGSPELAALYQRAQCARSERVWEPF